MVAGVFEFLGGGGSGEGDFEDGEVSFLSDGEESFFTGLVDINNLFFGDVDDLVKALDLSSDDFCDPKSTVHKLFGGLDGDEVFAFTKEKSESPRNVFA